MAGYLAGKTVVIDATVGAGGHAEALLDSGVGTVVGLDRDPEALAEASRRLAGRDGFRPVMGRFSRLTDVAVELGLSEVGGVLYDLGVSSMQLDRPGRGFSYRAEGPLDMRMGGGEDAPTAAEVVNGYSEEDLARIVFEYGEERLARRIARAIVRARTRAPITTTGQLASVVASAVGRRRGGPHPARRTFQALRIEVNREIEELAASLPQAAGLLEPGGRLAVISYHSIEDRTVKRFIASEPTLISVEKKPVRPTEPERQANPRARSAKLRVAEEVGQVAA